MKKPINVAVTGAAGNIGYALLFRLAAGDCFGSDQPIMLRLVEIPPGMAALEGVAMELDDCAFPLVHGIHLADNPEDGFEGVNQAFLVGSRPRGPGMQRADLVQANGPIFVGQGKALAAGAADDVRVLVVGNPANTNALILARNARGIPPSRFAAMTRLDQNRAISQLASKAGALPSEIENMIVWGNHSPTMYPDFANASIRGKVATDEINDAAWFTETFVPTVSKRGSAIIAARGASSAASAASAAIDHMSSWWHGTDGAAVSMGVLSDGQYGVPEGLMFSFPCTVDDGDYSIVEGVPHGDWAKGKIAASAEELIGERALVADLLKN